MKNNVQKMDLYKSPVREQNFEKYNHLENQCICCGKPLKSIESKFLHLDFESNAYNTTETFVDENGIHIISGTNVQSAGAFQVGNDCAKKMKGFVFEN